MSTDLRSRVIRLAAAQPSLRPHLLPLLKEATPRIPEEDAEVEMESALDVAHGSLSRLLRDGVFNAIEEKAVITGIREREARQLNRDFKSLMRQVTEMRARLQPGWEIDEWARGLKSAGRSYEMETIFLSLVPKKKNVPFNVDHIKAIGDVWVEADGGDVNPNVVDKRTSKGYFTAAQEKAGYKNETVLNLSLAKGTATATLKGIRAALPEFEVTVLPSWREPQTVTPR